MTVLPPGTFLQLAYLRERIKLLQPGRFVEIGPGSGEITELLLHEGWTGYAFEIDAETSSRLQKRFAPNVMSGQLTVVNLDFLTTPVLSRDKRVDVVISCMVMEHMDDAAESAYLLQAGRWLNEGGLLIGLVPASWAHWGIEDEIAGHCRRYTRNSIRTLMDCNGWWLKHIAGLSYPISNILLPISNFLVKRSESSKLNLSALERTKESGKRNVKFKTHFPAVLGVVLNRYTMLPFHLLQKVFSGSSNALVLYFEACPRQRIKRM